MKILNAILLIIILIISTGCLFKTAEIPHSQSDPILVNPKLGSKFLSVNKMNVHYRDSGSGEVVVALHGILDSLHTWEGSAPSISKNFRLIRLDLPGFGLTDESPNNDYSIDFYMNFLNKFLEKLKIKKCSIIGNSLGGLLAWKFAVTFPNKIKKIILLDSAAFPLEHMGRTIDLFFNPTLRSIMKNYTPRWAIKKSVKWLYGDPSRASDATLEHYILLSLRKGHREKYFKALKQISSYAQNSHADLKKITQPILLIWGKLDNFIPIDHVEKWKKKVPHAEILFYEDAGHMPQLEIPNRVAKDVISYLKRKQ